MTRRPLVLAVLLAVAVGAWPEVARAATASPRPRKVLVVSMPGMTWEDVNAGRAPSLRSLADRWSVAAMSVRTVGSRTDLPSALASIGAGNRARGLGDEEDPIQPETVDVHGGALEVRSMDAVREDNVRLRFGAVPGALGSALHRAGLRTGAVGNADGGGLPPTAPARVAEGLERRRFAGLALADEAGRLDAGEVGDGVVVRDTTTLNGYRADPGAMAEAVRQTLARADVVLVELADTYRESLIAYGRLEDSKVAAPQDDDPRRVAALGRDDALLGRIAREVDLSRDTLLVLGTTGIGPTRRERLTVAMMAGTGARRHGWLTSPSTRRVGLVGLTDAGPGILELLGLPPPAAMTAQSLVTVPGPTAAPDATRREELGRMQAAALFHSRWVSQFFIMILVLQLALYLFAWLRLPWGPQVPPHGLAGEAARSRAGAVRALALAVMGIPLASLLVRGVGVDLWGALAAGAVLVVVCAAMTAAALRGPWRRWPSGPPAFVCAVTGFVVVADLVTGSHLQISSLVGYSPIVAGRFFGVGNLVFAILGTSAMLVGAALAGRLRRWAPAIVGALGVVVVVAEGGPMFGADFGGLLALVPAFGLLGILVTGRQVSWRRVAALGAATVAGGLAVGYLDSLRPLDSQTHIGRFFTRLVQDGPSAVSEIVARKAAANWHLLATSMLTLSVPIAAVFVAGVLMRPAGRLRRALEEEPGLKWGLQAAVVVNVLGFAVNDSGIAITAMGLAVAVPYCLATVLGMTDAPPLPLAARAGPVRAAR